MSARCERYSRTDRHPLVRCHEPELRCDGLDAQLERLSDPADRRGTLVGLTPRGFELIDSLGERYLEEERAAVASLDAKEQTALAALLKKSLLGLEGPRTGPAPRR